MIHALEGLTQTYSDALRRTAAEEAGKETPQPGIKDVVSEKKDASQVMMRTVPTCMVQMIACPHRCKRLSSNTQLCTNHFVGIAKDMGVCMLTIQS